MALLLGCCLATLARFGAGSAFTATGYSQVNPRLATTATSASPHTGTNAGNTSVCSFHYDGSDVSGGVTG